jgi:hypothetical protein
MLTCFLALAATLATTTAGQPWAVVPLEDINVHPGHVAAAQQVLKDDVESLGQPVIVLEPDLADPDAAARARGVGC